MHIYDPQEEGPPTEAQQEPVVEQPQAQPEVDLRDLNTSYWVDVGAQGFVPKFCFFGLSLEGSPRPYRRFLEGERESVARYFMCLAAEAVFGESPLLPVESQDKGLAFEENPAWTNAPVLIETEQGEFKMSDGSSVFDITFPVPKSAEPEATDTDPT